MTLCDVFVMDAVRHRAPPGVARSTSPGVCQATPLLTMPNLDALAKALDNPARPLLAIVAGSKVSTNSKPLSRWCRRSIS